MQVQVIRYLEGDPSQDRHELVSHSLTSIVTSQLPLASGPQTAAKPASLRSTTFAEQPGQASCRIASMQPAGPQILSRAIHGQSAYRPGLTAMMVGSSLL
jgi:hypothetical protein